MFDPRLMSSDTSQGSLIVSLWKLTSDRVAEVWTFKMLDWIFLFMCLVIRKRVHLYWLLCGLIHFYTTLFSRRTYCELGLWTMSLYFLMLCSVQNCSALAHRDALLGFVCLFLSFWTKNPLNKTGIFWTLTHFTSFSALLSSFWWTWCSTLAFLNQDFFFFSSYLGCWD